MFLDDKLTVTVDTYDAAVKYWRKKIHSLFLYLFQNKRIGAARLLTKHSDVFEYSPV